MVLALTVTLPAAFAVGIASRREVPISPERVLAPSRETRNQSVLWSRNDLWKKGVIRTRLLTVEPGSGQFAIELMPMDQIVRPDLLVYWVPGARKVQDSLPEDAFLLGGFEQSTPTPLALPEVATKQTGVLVLYSLADHEIEAVSSPFSVTK
jgi:hypothetical protein